MRKKATFPDKLCASCGSPFTPSGSQQIYCSPCGEQRSIDRKREFYKKTNPNAYAVKEQKYCCVCGAPYACAFEDKPYCNKHYLRMRVNGTPEFIGRKHGNPYSTDGETSTLTTSSGTSFFVDESDLPAVLRYTWCLSKTGYLVANVNSKVMRLHRYLLSPDPGSIVDHIDGNPLNNRRTNLRICSNTENARNAVSKSTNLAGYQGIRITKSGKYSARIVVDRKEIYLGTFADLDSAIAARVKAEAKYYGEFSPSKSRSVT